LYFFVGDGYNNRSFFGVFAPYIDGSNIVVSENAHFTNLSIELYAFELGSVRNIQLIDNVAGIDSSGIFVEEKLGFFAHFHNISLDSARFERDTSFLPNDYYRCPIVEAEFSSTQGMDMDSVIWRDVIFRDNLIVNNTPIDDYQSAVLGRTVLMDIRSPGTFLVQNCQWVNNRISAIAPEVCLWPGPRNVGSTVELEGIQGSNGGGTDVVFDNCLFMDNDNGGLSIGDCKLGIVQNCSFIRTNRFGLLAFSNQDEGFIHVRNCFFEEISMQEYYLPEPQFKMYSGPTAEVEH